MLRFAVLDLSGLATLFWLALALIAAALTGGAALYGVRRAIHRSIPGAGAYGHRLWPDRCGPADQAAADSVAHEVAPRAITCRRCAEAPPTTRAAPPPERPSPRSVHRAGARAPT